MAQAQLNALPAEERQYMSVANGSFRVKVRRQIPEWLYFVIKNKSWNVDPRHHERPCALNIFLNNPLTGKRVHAELDRARHTRNLIVQMNQAFGLHHPVSMQLFQILIHLDIQQPRPGQGNPAAVFWKLYEAFQDANADPAYNMVAWAQNYYIHQFTHPQEQHPPVVVELSNKILEWTQQWPDVQNQVQATQPAQPALDQQAPPAQHQAHAMQLAQPPFYQQGHPMQQQGQAIQPVQPAFNQPGFVVQQEGQVMQPAQPAFNQQGHPVQQVMQPVQPGLYQQGYDVQQQEHLIQPAQHVLHQQGPVEAQHEGLAIQLALVLPALHQPDAAADHDGAADHGEPDQHNGAAHHSMVDDAAPYAAADHAAQAAVDDGAVDYSAAFADADGHGAPYGVAGHDAAGHDATGSARHGAGQDAGNDAAGGMPHSSSTDAMDEDNQLEPPHDSDWDRDSDFDTDMESLDSSQRAELWSQATGTDGVGQQFLPTPDHNPAHSQPGSSAHSDGHDSASVRGGDPDVLNAYESYRKEDMQEPMQPSIQSPGASLGMQASTSSQQGMPNALHLSSPSGDRSSPSTQESVYDLQIPTEQDLGQALISFDGVSMGDWGMSNEVQPVAWPAMAEADLRLALANVTARIGAQPSISREQARLIVQLVATFSAPRTGDRGDQAYFRFRAQGSLPMQTGAVALIRGGELHCIGASGPYQYNAGDQFGIVSDRYVKWKGGKIPSDVDESKGHWIAAIGQLPVMVKGTVGCNQFIVASLTDPPRGQALTAVSDPSAHQRVVALSLEGKESEAEGPVMAFAMYALPAIAGLVKTEVGQLWAKINSVADDLDHLKQTVPKQAQVDRIGAQCQQMETDISSLMLRLSVSPKEEAATLHSERFCGLSQSCEQIVGQEEQLKKLMGMAGDSSNRRSVFMILGAPGMGKTTLAKAFGWQLWTSQQVHSTFFADLKEANNIEEGLLNMYLAFEAAEGVGNTNMESRSKESVTKQICALLQCWPEPQRLCLVIDNAEGIVSSAANALDLAATLSKMLECKPTMVIIITSRTLAHLVNVQVHTEAMKPLTSEDAERLMRLVRPQTSQESAARLAELCANIPYALRLVGDSISESTTAEDMVDELTLAGFVQGLKLTAETAYLALERCVASSLKVMRPNDRLSLAQLSIFPSKFDAKAAAAVLGVEQRVAKRQLRHLQDRSLVIAEAVQPGQDAPQQYGLHLFIRDMAVSGYEQHDGYKQAQSRFVEYFVAMLCALEHHHTPAGLSGIRQLASQRHNLVKLFSLLAAQPQPVTANILAACCRLPHAALNAIWVLRLDQELVFAAMENLLKWADADSLTSSIIDAQEQLGFMLTRDSNKVDRAEQLLRGALQARQQAGQEGMLLVLPLVGLARAVNDRINASDIDESQGYLQGLQLCKDAHVILVDAKGESDPETLSVALFSCSFIQQESEQVKAITAVLESALKSLPPDHPAVLDIKSELAAASNNQLAESIPALTQYLEQCMSQGGHDEQLVPDAMLRLGNALAFSKEAAQQEEGLQYLYKGLKLAEACYNIEDLIIARQETLGRALIAAKRFDDAIKVLQDSLPICEKERGKDSRITWIGYTILADAFEAKGDYNAASRAFETAHSRIRQSAKRKGGQEDEEVFVVKSGIRCQIALNLELRGRLQEADNMHTEAVRLVGSSEATWFLERGDHYLFLAGLRRRQARFSEAVELLQQAIVDARGDVSQLQSIKLEKALLASDMGQHEAAIKGLLSFIDQCDDDDGLLVDARNSLGWLHFCQQDWGGALKQFEEAAGMLGCFVDGSADLEMAISFAGAAAAQMRLLPDANTHADEEKATQFLDRFPFPQADGVQVARYCLGVCKMLRGCEEEGQQLFADALSLQHKLCAVDHPSNAVFQSIFAYPGGIDASVIPTNQDHLQEKVLEQHRTTVSLIANASDI